MNWVTIFHNDYATISYSPDGQIVHQTIHQPMQSQDFRDLLVKVLDTFQQYKISKWLSDDRGNRATSPEDNVWTQSVWQPQALAAGWKTWAIVVPEDMAARANWMHIFDVLEKTGVRAMVFTEVTDALQWLERI